MGTARLELPRWVLPEAWGDARWLRLPHVARCLYLYVVLAPENAAAGVYLWDRDSAMVRMGWTPDELKLAERRLVVTGRVRFYKAADGRSWVWQVTRWALVSKMKKASAAACGVCESELAQAPPKLVADFRQRYPGSEPAPVKKAPARRMPAAERPEWAEQWGAATTALELFNGPDTADRGPDAMRSWSVAYPALDVSTSLREAHAWLVSNGGETKRSNMLRFLHNWMRRAAKDGTEKGRSKSERWGKLKAEFER